MNNKKYNDLNSIDKNSSDLSVKYKGIEIKANLIYRNRKTITIQIKPKEQVTVISPNKVPRNIIKDILMEKGDWILEKLEEYNQIKDFYIEREFITGDKFFYLGEELILQVVENNCDENLRNKNPKIVVEDSKLVFKTNNTDKEYVKKYLKEWYKKESEKIVLERLIHCREKSQIMMQLIPSKLKVKEQKKRWGTCTSKRTIYINSKISMARVEAIDYILIHEFSHLIHMNHSKDFYNLVKSIMPNYKQNEDWLKKNSYKLIL